MLMGHREQEDDLHMDTLVHYNGDHCFYDLWGFYPIKLAYDKPESDRS